MYHREHTCREGDMDTFKLPGYNLKKTIKSTKVEYKTGWSVIQTPTTLQLSGTHSGQSEITIRKALQSLHLLDMLMNSTPFTLGLRGPLYHTLIAHCLGYPCHYKTISLPSPHLRNTFQSHQMWIACLPPSPSLPPSQRRMSINSSHSLIHGSPRTCWCLPSYTEALCHPALANVLTHFQLVHL